jgi:hypothetical protein
MFAMLMPWARGAAAGAAVVWAGAETLRVRRRLPASGRRRRAIKVILFCSGLQVEFAVSADRIIIAHD